MIFFFIPLSSLIAFQGPGKGLFLILFRLLERGHFCLDHSYWSVFHYLELSFCVSMYATVGSFLISPCCASGEGCLRPILLR
jgi:hypothetical protein